ncbi:hypothetical protein OS493_032766 [Desmophyllum pertusum]|uniref:Uncharacterized protein n=1 Tax=Desmophyllum pertusum TaxID=174260 RepID=A0A9W9ZJY6_9CNID|nr:hypothetical protein OS493_032766 [Desmophyllum pertusum]
MCFQLTYAALFDALIHEEKRNQCNGCAIHHPSQREHSCVMMDSEDAWMYYRDDVVEKIDLNIVLKLQRNWKDSARSFQPKQLQDRILYAIYYGPNGINGKIPVIETILRTLNQYNALKPLLEKMRNQWNLTL